MPTVECYDCKREFDEAVIKWVRYNGPVLAPDDSEAIKFAPVVLDRRDFDTLAFCHECLKARNLAQ